MCLLLPLLPLLDKMLQGDGKAMGKVVGGRWRQHLPEVAAVPG